MARLTLTAVSSREAWRACADVAVQTVRAGGTVEARIHAAILSLCNNKYNDEY